MTSQRLDSLPAYERAGRRVVFGELAGERGPLFPKAPECGVVVGTFAGVAYVHLQLEARRRYYPGVPLLVHDDGSPVSGRLAELCESYGADFERNTSRLPPCKGDLSAFAGGFVWARERGVEVLLKLSRRFVPRCDWRDSLGRLALASQYATFCSWTTSFNFGFRTECVAMAVVDGWRRGLGGEVALRIGEPGEPFVEGFMHDLARRAARARCAAAREYDARTGERPPERNGYAVWDWMGTDRKARTKKFLWHDWASPEDYRALGARWGLPYGFAEYADANGGCGSRA